jgi:tetratricopeptide (TPR) repeat protein
MKELVATAQAIGGLAFLTNTKAAIGAYRLLIKLTPEDWLSWYQLSILELRVGNYNKAVTAAQKVRDIGQENKEEAVVARSQGLMSVIARQRSELREAETLGKKAVNSLRGTNDRKALAVELGNLGIVKRLLGKYGESEKLHKEALQIEESLDSYLGRAREYGNLGALLRVRGSNFQEQAVAYISLSLEYNEKAGSKIGVAIRLNQLGEFAMQRKDWDSARSRFNEALKIERELEDRYGEAMVISNLGRLHKFLAQFSEHPE